jgi:RHS repeat-associated protein
MTTQSKLSYKSLCAAGRACFIVLVIALGGAVNGRAQTSPERGFSSGGSYTLSDIESVGITNGNVGLQVPITSLPAGRGGAPGAGLKLIYNSKVWDTPTTIIPDGTYDNYGVPGGRPQHYLRASPEGGWRYAAGYEVRLVNRLDEYTYSPLKPSCEQQSGTGTHDADYIYKLQVIYPDGSAHDLAPQGYQNAGNTTGDGYYNIRPDGYLTYCSCVITIMGPSCTKPNALNNSGTMTYYSTDGTYIRLDIPHDSDTNQWNNVWTIYMPDATRVVGSGLTGVGSNLPPGYPGSERIYDRNDNYVDIQITNALISIVDEFNRSITVNRDPSQNIDHINAAGFGGEPMVWTVRWKSVYVYKSYNSADINAGCSASMSCTSGVGWAFRVIDGIDLPTQSGGLSYSFGYNGNPTASNDPGTRSPGWGELNSVTLPSGAAASYAYRQDDRDNIPWDEVLQNHPTSKTLSYRQEYDGSSNPATEVWSYSFSFGRATSTSTLTTVTAPDGGQTTDYINNSNATVPLFDDGLSYRTVNPDGTVIERTWASNSPYGHFGPARNAYVKTEFTSTSNASGSLSKTAIKDFDYDKNGNVTRISEYDWAAYGDVPRTNPGFGITGKPTGLPPGVQPKRVTLNTYYAPTQNASASNQVDSPNSYSKATSPRLRNLVSSSELSGEVGGTLSRTEFYYDDPSTTGNITEQRSWDSTKGALLALTPDGSRLDGSNSVSVITEYDPQFKNRTLTTGLSGMRTKYVYGEVLVPAGTVTGLYPTEIKIAEGTAVERRMLLGYDFYSGLVTNSTDADNNVSSSTAYDAFGRPVLVKMAVGTAQEIHMQTEYSDVDRRVITRSDVDVAGDGKLIYIQHYDQLGRPRLRRMLEDPETQSATDEQSGIKAQTRYTFSGANSFSLTSNSYRAATSTAAAAEDTMGWSVSTDDRGGHTIRVETFDGSGLPAPWGLNTHTTGAVTFSYDVDSITVIDQAGKTKKTFVDGLGRLSKVVEAPDIPNYNYQTSYSYDALGNLKQVAQGAQTRTFNYSSLSRLMSATYPEACRQVQNNCTPLPTTYEYFPGGNLKRRSDARGVVTDYTYDELVRLKTRVYSGEAGTQTPPVTYTYDDPTIPYSKGRMTSVVSSATSYSYTGYDALGRVKGSSQLTDGVTYSMPDYQYNLAGGLKSERYPSGRVVVTEYDKAARIAGVSNPASGLYYVGASPNNANRIAYAAHGGASAILMGNGLWEHTGYNSRLQPVQVGLGTAPTNSSKLQLDFLYGVDDARNSGNVRSQNISIPGVLALSQNYTYDDVNRLETAAEKNTASPCHNSQGVETDCWKQIYSYDPYGNRTLAAGTTYPAQLNASNNPAISLSSNRITSSGYAYDDAGNLLCDPTRQCTQTPQLIPYFTYDAENRLMAAGGGPANNGSSYTYDGNGRRVKKTVGTENTKTVFVYDAEGRLVAEYDNAQPQHPSGGTTFLTQDPMGSTRAESDSAGVKSRHDYLPFGEEVDSAVLPSGRGAVPSYNYGTVRQKFTGYERDVETELDYAGARYFSSSEGRFTSPDPLFSSALRPVPQSWNRYSYVMNNPMKYADPSGEKWIKLSNGTTFFDPDVNTDAQAQRKYHDRGAKIVDGKRIVITESNDPRFKVGHEYILSSSGRNPQYIDLGVYTPPSPPPLSTEYGDRLAWELLKLDFKAIRIGATGGIGGIALLLDTAHLLRELSTDENDEDQATEALDNAIDAAQAARGAFTEPTLPPGTIVEENGVSVEHKYRSNDHAPAHAHVYEGGKEVTKIGPSGKPLTGEPPLTPRSRTVVQRNQPAVRNSLQKISRWLKWRHDYNKR